MAPPHQPLISKLRDYCKCKRKTNKKNAHASSSLDDNVMRKIATKMPRTMATLASILNEEQIKVHADQILSITQDHKRDQVAFEDCTAEIGAFVSGGPYAMDILDKVYRRILAHFKMMPDMDDVLLAKCLYINPKTQKITQWGAKTDEDQF
jgi:hypothetical protein